jgi:phage shock protein E
MSRFVMLFFTLFLFTSFTQLTLAADHTKDTIATIKKNLAAKKAVLIDVREKAEWERGHLKAAILVPLSMLSEKEQEAKVVKLLPKKKIIYCHCRSGGRARAAGDILEELGYDVRPLRHGFFDLVDSGFEEAKQ